MNLQVGVKIFIRDDDQRYLFLRRSPLFKTGPQKWDIPGGRIEAHETLHSALAREVKEETGLEITAVESLRAAQDIFAPDKDLHVVRLTYIGTATGEIKISHEHDAYKWMTKKEIDAEPLVDSYIQELFNGKDV